MLQYPYSPDLECEILPQASDIYAGFKDPRIVLMGAHMTAIITAGETRQSLAAVRALGRAHVPVAVCAKKRPALAMWSRYATSTFLAEDEDQFSHEICWSKSVKNFGRATEHARVPASTDNAWWALSRYRELLPIAARKILPPHYSVVRSLDHEALHHFAKSLNIPCAELVRVPEDASLSEVDRLLKELSFPLLLRPIIPWVEREEGIRHVEGRLVVQSKAHLQSLLGTRPGLKNGFLVSAYNSMRAISFFGVAEKGQVLVEGFQERLNEAEPYNEVATLAVTMSPVPAIRNHAQNLLNALSWQGPFKVEFIKDQRGNYRLISLIGRLWGSLSLAIKADVNIPLICYRLAEGTLTSDLLKNARSNVRLRWLLGDAEALLMHPYRIAANIKGFVRKLNMSSFFKSRSGKEKIQTYYDVFDMDDPMPFIYELQNKTWKKAFGMRE